MASIVPPVIVIDPVPVVTIPFVPAVIVPPVTNTLPVPLDQIPSASDAGVIISPPFTSTLPLYVLIPCEDEFTVPPFIIIVPVLFSSFFIPAVPLIVPALTVMFPLETFTIGYADFESIVPPEITTAPDELFFIVFASLVLIIPEAVPVFLIVPSVTFKIPVFETVLLFDEVVTISPLPVIVKVPAFVTVVPVEVKVLVPVFKVISCPAATVTSSLISLLTKVTTASSLLPAAVIAP